VALSGRSGYQLPRCLNTPAWLRLPDGTEVAEPQAARRTGGRASGAAAPHRSS